MMSVRKFLLAVTSTLAIVQAAPGLAQSAPSGSGAADDIIVTARRVEERLQDVPISITAFNQQQLSNRNILTPADLATYTPSLETNNFFGTSKTEFSIRGFVQDIGTQPSVGIYFADVVAPRAPSVNVPAGDGAGPGSLFDLQNIQVLKGPQGTLFGRNTTGGAVLLVPQKPTDKVGGYVEGSYGNYDMYRVQAVFNAPLGDKARFRIGFDRAKRDGYLRNTGGIGPDRYNGTNYWAVRASLVVDLTPDLENYTIASYSRSDAFFTQKIAGCDPATFLGGLACDQRARAAARGDGFYTVQSALADPYDRQRQWQIINTTTWTASDTLTVKNIASYAQYTERYSSEIFGTQFDVHDVPGLGALYPAGTSYISLATSQPGGATIDNANQYTFTDEFRLQGNAFDNRLAWQGGIYVEISKPLGQTGAFSQSLLSCSDLFDRVCNNPIGAGGVVQYLTRTDLQDYGAYAQGTYKLSDTFSVTGGIRYTWDKTRTDANLFSYLYDFNPGQEMPSAKLCAEDGITLPACAITYKIHSQKPTWLVDLDYKPTRDILIYAKYARGYRAGNISPNAPQQVATYQPEKLDSYEVGFKTSWRGPVRGTFDVSAFYNNLTNQQLLILLTPIGGNTAPPISGTLNAGKSRIAGVEVNGSITPFDGVTLDGAYTYLATKLKSIAAGGIDSTVYKLGAAEQPGDPLPLSPKNKFTLTGTYTLPLDKSIGEIAISATFVHVDKLVTGYSSRNADGSLGPFDVVPHRDLVNLNLNWTKVAGTPVDLSVFATNLTDKHYYSFYGPLYGSAGFATGAVGEPRMFGARLRYTFGG